MSRPMADKATLKIYRGDKDGGDFKSYDIIGAAEKTG